MIMGLTMAATPAIASAQISDDPIGDLLDRPVARIVPYEPTVGDLCWKAEEKTKIVGQFPFVAKVRQFTKDEACNALLSGIVYGACKDKLGDFNECADKVSKDMFGVRYGRHVVTIMPPEASVTSGNPSQNAFNKTANMAPPIDPRPQTKGETCSGTGVSIAVIDKNLRMAPSSPCF